jgi:hypothetical protein
MQYSLLQLPQPLPGLHDACDELVGVGLQRGVLQPLSQLMIRTEDTMNINVGESQPLIHFLS